MIFAPLPTTTLACWKQNLPPAACLTKVSTCCRWEPTTVSAELGLMRFPNESEPLGGITQIFKVSLRPRCLCSSSGSMRLLFSVKVLPGHFGHITCRLWYNNVIICWPPWLSCRITPWPPCARPPAQPALIARDRIPNDLSVRSPSRTKMCT